MARRSADGAALPQKTSRFFCRRRLSPATGSTRCMNHSIVGDSRLGFKKKALACGRCTPVFPLKLETEPSEDSAGRRPKEFGLAANLLMTEVCGVQLLRLNT
jgi:hypothetical protein